MGPPPRRGRGGPPRRYYNRRNFRGGFRQMPRRPNQEYQVIYALFSQTFVTDEGQEVFERFFFKSLKSQVSFLNWEIF